VENLGICPILDGTIYTAEAFEEDHDIPLRVDKAQQNSVPFEKMGISEWRQ
jgi:hypothetical protein